MQNEDDHGGVTVYCTRGHACWVVVLLLGVVTAIVVTLPGRPTPVGPVAPGVVVFLLLVVAALITIAEINTDLRVRDEGLLVRAWPHPDRMVPWERIAGMRWRHGWWRWLAEGLGLRLQPGAHGVVELAIADDAGTPHWTTIANYVCCGTPPGTVHDLLAEIARRAGLSQVAQRPPTIRPKFEETQWARELT